MAGFDSCADRLTRDDDEAEVCAWVDTTRCGPDDHVLNRQRETATVDETFWASCHERLSKWANNPPSEYKYDAVINQEDVVHNTRKRASPRWTTGMTARKLRF